MSEETNKVTPENTTDMALVPVAILADLSRLRRIEAAARKVVESAELIIVGELYYVGAEEIDALRLALSQQEASHGR